MSVALTDHSKKKSNGIHRRKE